MLVNVQWLISYAFQQKLTPSWTVKRWRRRSGLIRKRDDSSTLVHSPQGLDSYYHLQKMDIHNQNVFLIIRLKTLFKLLNFLNNINKI